MAKNKSNNELDDILERKKPIETTATIVLEPALAEARDEAKMEHRRMRVEARRQTGSEAEADELLADLQADVDEWQSKVDEATIVFRFQAIGRHEYDKLQEIHAPTKKQVEDFAAKLKSLGMPNEVLQYNPDTFPGVLIAACCVEPSMSAQDGQRLWNSDKFSHAELAIILQAAVRANNIIVK